VVTEPQSSAELGAWTDRPLLNLLRLTAQVRQRRTGNIVGTACIIDRAGTLLTCAHVVADALATSDRTALSGESIAVYIPQADIGLEPEQRASVLAVDAPADLALLRLHDGVPMEEFYDHDFVGSAHQSIANAFRAYGYSPSASSIAQYTQGTIASAEWIQINSAPVPRVRLVDCDIGPGMSGAPVLDASRNLVVGLITARVRGRRTGWATSLDRLPELEPPLRLARMGRPAAVSSGAPAKWAMAAPRDPILQLETAPPAPTDWVGRPELLFRMTKDYVDGTARVLSLVGLGGQGKSSLARRWLDLVLSRTSPRPPAEKHSQSTDLSRVPSALGPRHRPAAVLWWSLYTNRRGIDEFLDALLRLLSSNRFRAQDLPGSDNKLRYLVNALRSSPDRYIVVLDGLELLQRGTDRGIGSITSQPLRELLEIFAREDHRSLLLVTSRLTVVDAIPWPRYREYEVAGLSDPEGSELLIRLGVQGDPGQLREVSCSWDGHPLALTLAAGQLANPHDIAALQSVGGGAAESGLDLYDKVERLLRSYDNDLSSTERAVLRVCSLFREHVPLDGLRSVWAASSLRRDGTDDINAVVAQLQARRLLQGFPVDDRCAIHALVQGYYAQQFELAEPVSKARTHALIADYYSADDGFRRHTLRLEDLSSSLEAVHHASSAMQHARAFQLMWERVARRENYTIALELGANETAIRMMEDLFIDRDASKGLQDPSLPKPVILNAYGYSLMEAGRLSDARPVLESLASESGSSSWGLTSLLVHRNLAQLYGHLGELAASAKAAEQLASLAAQLAVGAPSHAGSGRRHGRDALERTEIAHYTMSAPAWLGWCYFLLGDIDRAEAGFAGSVSAANRLGHPYPWFRAGVAYADYLRLHRQDLSASRLVLDHNLVVSRQRRRGGVEALCLRGLGDWAWSSGDPGTAEQRYNQAFDYAMQFPAQHIMLEILATRGRFRARRGTVRSAAGDLADVLERSVQRGYRVVHIDARVGLAWLQQRLGRPEHAEREAARALAASLEIGYIRGASEATSAMDVAKEERRRHGYR
jgi:tetratricopeptide (TPR) repeat protein